MSGYTNYITVWTIKFHCILQTLEPQTTLHSKMNARKWWEMQFNTFRGFQDACTYPWNHSSTIASSW